MDFGDSIKPFYHQSPKTRRESTHPANFVLEEISRLNRNNNNALERSKIGQRSNKIDEKFYVPKPAPPIASKPSQKKGLSLDFIIVNVCYRGLCKFIFLLRNSKITYVNMQISWLLSIFQKVVVHAHRSLEFTFLDLLS